MTINIGDSTPNETQPSTTQHSLPTSATTECDHYNGIMVINHHHYHHHYYYPVPENDLLHTTIINNESNSTKQIAPSKNQFKKVTPINTCMDSIQNRLATNTSIWKEVTESERVQFPYCLVGLLEARYAGDLMRGTGTLLDAVTIITAALVVSVVDPGPIISITFIPGYSRNQNNPEPFGRYTMTASSIRFPLYLNVYREQPGMDYALILLNNPIQFPGLFQRIRYPIAEEFQFLMTPALSIIAYPYYEGSTPRDRSTMIRTNSIGVIRLRLPSPYPQVLEMKAIGPSLSTLRKPTVVQAVVY